MGLIESADGGTLFLDEIGEMDLGLQAKLLRVLENFKVRRLGSLTDRQVNVRIVAATNRDLDIQVREGRFRSDLLYRLRVFQIQIPPCARAGMTCCIWRAICWISSPANTGMEPCASTHQLRKP